MVVSHIVLLATNPSKLSLAKYASIHPLLSCALYELFVFSLFEFLSLMSNSKACGEAIAGQNINALNSYWHPEHFCCQMCKITFPTGQFYQHNGFPYCPTHYMQMQQMMSMQGGGGGGMQPGGM
jgi:hypothetical protein